MSRKLISLVLALAFPVSALAQFTHFGTDSPKVRWSVFSTKDYRLIYPRGTDSLALVYGKLLQGYNIPVGLSAGVVPNYSWKKPMPVILRTSTADANGAVIWAPRRMELFTLPDSRSSLSALPWETMLAIHENRHVAQMQFPSQGFWGWTRYVFGQIAQIGVQSLLLDSCIMEGDAVVAETGLTNAGRGRSAEFLSYMKMAFDNGDMRTWARWRYGSLTRYTPDYYRLGYMTVAGVRYLYDAPLYMSEILDAEESHFLTSGFRTIAGRHAGKKFRYAWDEITGTFKDIWTMEDSLRAPFSEVNPLTGERKGYTVYSSPVTLGGDIFAVKASLDSPSSLVQLDPSGRAKRLAGYGGEGKMAVSDALGRIFWAETFPGIRYEMQQDSRIRYYDRSSGSVSSLTRKGRYYNPSVAPGGNVLCVSEFPLQGGSAIVVLDALDGNVLDRKVLPSGLQLTEAVPAEGRIYFAAICDGGNCLYEIPFDGRRITGEMALLLGPEPVSLKDLRVLEDGSLLFVSDRTGNSDAYRYSCDTGLFRLTNTHYGLSSPFVRDGKLFASVLRPEGRIFSEVEMSPEPACFDEIHQYPVADRLSAQEEALAVTFRSVIEDADTTVSTARPWRKAGHFIYIHSWAPVYVDYNRIKATYSDYFYELASPGAMALFQNHLGTFSGSAGISLHPKPLKDDRFLPGLHLRASWRAVFPVFDFALDVGDRMSHEFRMLYHTDRDSLSLSQTVYRPDSGRPHLPSKSRPYIGGSASVSIPLNLSSGGWERNIDATIMLKGSNDIVVDPELGVKKGPDGTLVEDDTYNSGHGWTYYSMPHQIVFSLNGRFVRETAPSQMGPSAGAGFGLEASRYRDFSWAFYGKGYAYLPGFHPRHSVKLSGDVRYIGPFQFSYLVDDRYPLLPRGLVRENDLAAYLAFDSPLMGRASFDYAMPLLSVDFSIGRFVYIRNFEVVPFADISLLSPREAGHVVTLYSAGTDIAVNFQRLIATRTLRLGARLSWNGGSAVPFLKDYFTKNNPFRVGFIMNAAF